MKKPFDRIALEGPGQLQEAMDQMKDFDKVMDREIKRFGLDKKHRKK